jgi:hypothetical protein
MNPEELITVECTCDCGILDNGEECDLCDGDGYLELTKGDYDDYEFSILE